MPMHPDFFTRFGKAPISLANRVLALQLIWAFIVYILFIAALWFATNIVILNNVRHQGETWITKLDELGIPVYASNDSSQLSEAISFARNIPEILSARYLGPDGKKLIAAYTKKDAHLSSFKPLDDDAIEQLKRIDLAKKEMHFEKGKNFQMRISAPIWIKSVENDGMIDFSMKEKTGEKIETIGLIDIVIDYSQISNELNRNLVYASLVIAVLMMAAAYIGRRLVRWALRPLSDLEEPLTRLANGETDVTVKTSGDKEIAKIGMALNTTINALKERDETLLRIANHDSLTGLANRKYFVEQLEREIGRIAGNGSSSALFFFDLDRFKFINDTYGHAAGDRLLIQIAKLLSQRTRGKDLAARFGGDEFTLLAYNINQKGAQELAEAFIQLMREFVFYEAGEMLKIHFSIGVSMIDDGSLSSHDYLKEADAAVHEAKSSGRNGYRMAMRDSGSTLNNNTGWHQRLQNVLDQHQAIPYFQPLSGLKLQTEKINEIFMRIPDEERGVLSASAFTPVAERFGMMAELDRQIVRKAAEILAAKQDPEQVLSLNLSEQFITDKNVFDFLKQTVEEFRISPRQFIFELPEHQVVRNIDKLQQIIPALTKTGFRFAIDDFGASFASLNFIKQLPVQFLKINSSLIERISQDNIDRISVRSIVDIAGGLNMQTIAKFVPDDESVALLRQLGVDYVQGNFIRQPSEKLEDRKNEHFNRPANPPDPAP